jgi:tetratricopeptide (TPR) repeat protein
MAQRSDASGRIFIHGDIINSEGRAVPSAMVELRDLRGVKMGSGLSNSTGSFAFTTPAQPGQYVLLAAKQMQIADQRIVLDQPDLEVRIALPVVSGNVRGSVQQKYMVSADELGVPEKARVHLKLANQSFAAQNFAGAEREIAEALRIDRNCAAAFSMRAFLKMAANNPSDAVEDAKQAMILDPYEPDAYVALAMAYNSLRKFQNAEEALEQALVFRPDSWQGQLELSKALYGEGRFVLALHVLDDLSKDFPDVHLVRANVLVRLQRGHEAADEFTRFLQEAPDDARSAPVKQIVANISSAPDSSFSLHP